MLLPSVEYNFCAKFQVIPIRGFRFIMLAYIPTHTHTHRDKVIAISALPIYVVDADNYTYFQYVFSGRRTPNLIIIG